MYGTENSENQAKLEKTRKLHKTAVKSKNRG